MAEDKSKETLLNGLLSYMTVRSGDGQGDGHYGASRIDINGSRSHAGVDLLANPEDIVIAPENIYFTGIGNAYADANLQALNPDLKSASFRFDDNSRWKGYTLLLVYFTANENCKLFTLIKKGTIIGKVQNVKKYHIGMMNHLHTELFNNGSHVNPEEYFTPSNSVKNSYNKTSEQAKKEKAEPVDFIYKGKENITVDDFIKQEFISKGKNKRISFTNYFFQHYVGDTEISNRDRIWATYTDEEKEKYKTNYSAYSLPYIKPNTLILMPISEIDMEKTVLYGHDQFLEQKNYSIYWNNNYKRLIESEDYVPEHKEVQEGYINSKAEIRNQNIKVLIVPKTNTFGDTKQDNIRGVYDVSKFISNVSTSKNMNVGNFSIELEEIPPMSNTDADSFSVTSSGELITYLGLDSSKFNFGEFETVFQNNDLVYIRFEKLKLEQEQRSDNFADQLLVDYSKLPYKESNGKLSHTWDFIGLITSVNVSYSASQTNKSLSIQGMDFMKLLTEDSCNFTPLRFIDGSNRLFLETVDRDSSIFKRCFIDGTINTGFTNRMKGIKETIAFIVNHLSNIQILPDYVFSMYGDRQSTSLKGVQKTEDTFTFSGDNQETEVKGVWKIIKFFVEGALDDRLIVDDSFVNPEGSLLEFFKRVCQDPFVEFFGDTYLDTFDFTVRQPPFNRKAISDVLVSQNYISIQDSDLDSYNLSFDERAYSWYQILGQDSLFGGGGYLAQAIIPVIYFNKVAEIYGNKQMIQTCNYLSQEAIYGTTGDENFNLFIRKLVNDLIYLIETNVYLSFTRRGSITLNGDRRIKVGTFIKLEKTNELLYVTGVSQSAQFSASTLNRTTVVTVERGMITNFILGGGEKRESVSKKKEEKSTVTSISSEKKVTTNGITSTEIYSEIREAETGYSKDTESITYFNIADLDLIRRTIIVKNENAAGSTEKEQEVPTFGLNEDVFNFFLHRRQFFFSDKYKADLSRTFGYGKI